MPGNRGKHPRSGSRSDAGRWLAVLTAVRIAMSLASWWWDGNGARYRF